MDILFICKKRNEYENEYGEYGQQSNKPTKPHLTFGLHNSAQFVVNYLTARNFNTEVVTALDGNDIDRLVTANNPKVVIVEALWATPDKFRELFKLKRHQNRTWIVRLHSRIGFIANEGIAFPWLTEYAKIPGLIVAPNTEEFATDLARIFNMPTIYLPNIYYTDQIEVLPKTPKKITRASIDIGCFGAVRPMKNHLNQAVAAVKFAENNGLMLNFHINSTRVEQAGGNVLKNLQAFFGALTDHKLVEHGWLSHNDFCELVRTMDMGMQVSFTETYNIVAADFVSNNVPLVGSQQITWLPQMFQADPNSTENITETLDRAWWGSVVGLHKFSKYCLMKNIAEAEHIWLDYMKKTV